MSSSSCCFIMFTGSSTESLVPIEGELTLVGGFEAGSAIIEGFPARWISV